jgi:energy-coupling factor transporter ATP-binding protein EcfA2
MKQTNKTLTILSPQQQQVFNQLIPIARLATSGRMANLPFKTRAHSLIIGPSGSGKSHIARAMGAELDLPTLVICVSSWVVLSARNEPWTLSLICEWLNGLCGGGILVLDEVDKLGGSLFSGSGNGEWSRMILTELLDLLDGIIPLATRLPELPEECWSPKPGNTLRETLSRVLSQRVFIVACGAWQHAWRENGRHLGFGPDAAPASQHPNCEQILRSMEPEFRQRFRSEVCWLSPMAYTDYLEISERVASELQEPALLRSWKKLALPMIDNAAAAGHGMRVFEEIMLAALLDSQECEPRPRINSVELI